MKRYNILLVFFFLSAALLTGCQEDSFAPLGDDTTKPQPIASPEVENIPGGAKISYTSPNDPNLLYILAEYELKEGIKMQAKASYYKNYIVVEGFGTTDEREVTLYAVSRSEVKSNPITVKINPFPAPIYDVYHSLDVSETFGGILVGFDNPAAMSGGINSNIQIATLIWDEVLKEWRPIDTHYSGLLKEVYSVRGLESKKMKFGFYLKDRWSNLTDTLEMELTPVYEELLNKKLWKDYRGKNPVPQVGVLPASGNPMKEGENYSGSYPMTNLWDDKTTSMYHTKQAIEQPIWNPFDLGVTAKLSRYKIWQRLGSSWPFDHGNPHEWEIWGTNTPNDPSSWVLIDHQIMEKPSGLPAGQISNDDRAISDAGQEYDFPLTAPAVRYLSWKHIDSWATIEGSSGFLHMSELTIWGQVQ